jgi:ribonucleoside-diphosphate reductase alpha chain
MKIYNYDEAFQLSLEYFEGDELAAKVFLDKYALRDNQQNLLEATPEHMHRRIAFQLLRG